MANNSINTGKQVINRYNELKSTMKKKGTQEETDTGPRYFANDNITLSGDNPQESSFINWGSVVDDNPRTTDEITVSTYSSDVTINIEGEEKHETFVEKKMGDRQVVILNESIHAPYADMDGYLEYTHVYDAKTGQELKPRKRKTGF